MDEEYEELYDEELTDRRKKDILEKMSKEDLLTFAYAIAEKTYESKNMFSEKQLEEKRELWDLSDEKKNTYILCAKKSTLKLFDSSTKSVIDTMISMNENMPKEIKDIVINQLLFDATAEELLSYAIEGEKDFLEENTKKSADMAKRDINTEKTKKFFQAIDETIQTEKEDEKIKESVVQFWLRGVKAKKPNLSKESEESFRKSILKSINRGYNSFTGTSITMDWDPSSELVDAYCSIEESESGTMGFFDIRSVFPSKTTTTAYKGQYAVVYSEFEENEYLYMTDKYRIEEKQKIAEQIKQQEDKVPEDVKLAFENEFEEEQRQQVLLDTYTTQISSIENSDMSEEGKAQKKQELMDKLKMFSEKHKYDSDKFGRIDKQKYMQERYVKYANEKNQQIWEEWNKAEHKIEKWPDKSNIPEELDRMYSNINMIKRYEKSNGIDKEIPNEKIQFTDMIAEAYINELEEKGYIDTKATEKTEVMRNKLKRYILSYYEEITSEYESPAFSFNSKFNEKGIYTLLGISKNENSNRYSMFSDNGEISIKVEDGIISREGGWDKEILNAIPEKLQEKKEKVENRIAFYKEIEESFRVSTLEEELDMINEYQEAKEDRKPSLKELDSRKARLEEKESQLRDKFNELDLLNDQKGEEI